MGVMKNGISIVDADRKHARFLAWVMLTAHRSHLKQGMWDFVVGGSSEDCLKYLEALSVTEQSHWAHYSTFIIAEVEGKPAAALGGYFDETHSGSALVKGMSEANRVLSRSEEEFAAGWQRAGSIIHVAPEHAPGVWIVENVATKPEFRRQGLINLLLTEILARGRARGATMSDISVLIGNDSAQAAYEKIGFEKTGEKRHPEFEAAYKCPGIRTLGLSL